MMVRISCQCGHAGIASDAILPAVLRCWQCGASRRIEAEHCRGIVSEARFAEWMEGSRPRPQVRKAVSR